MAGSVIGVVPSVGLMVAAIASPGIFASLVPFGRNKFMSQRS
jgi:hypothetical protein